MSTYCFLKPVMLLPGAQMYNGVRHQQQRILLTEITTLRPALQHPIYVIDITHPRGPSRRKSEREKARKRSAERKAIPEKQRKRKIFGEWWLTEKRRGQNSGC